MLGDSESDVEGDGKTWLVPVKRFGTEAHTRDGGALRRGSQRNIEYRVITIKGVPGRCILAISLRLAICYQHRVAGN